MKVVMSKKKGQMETPTIPLKFICIVSPKLSTLFDCTPENISLNISNSLIIVNKTKSINVNKCFQLNCHNFNTVDPNKYSRNNIGKLNIFPNGRELNKGKAAINIQ